MTSEQILEQLFDTGVVISTIDLIPNKLQVTLKNLTPEALFTVDKERLEITGSKLSVLQSYALLRVSSVIVSWNSTKFTTVNEAYTFLSKQPTSLIDKLLKEHEAFEKQIKTALAPESVDSTFFVPDASHEKQDQ